MNGLERIMCAITGNDPDVQPFTMSLSLYGASLIKAKTVDYYKNVSVWFEGQHAVASTFDPDILLTPLSFPLEASAFGSELLYIDRYAPNVKKPIITNVSQLNDLHVPDVDTSPALQFLLQSASLLAGTYKGNKAIAAPVHSPTDLPALLMGVEMWLDTLLFHPNWVETIMEKTTEHFVQLGNEFLARGATFLVVPVNFLNPMIVTEKIILMLLPYLQRALSQIKGPVVIHNGGCKIIPFINRQASLPGVVAFVLEPSESFSNTRRIIGDSTVLMGNFDGPQIINMSASKAVETCLKILNDRKDDKHFIFATSNADIPYDTPPDTLKAMVDTIRNFKK